jgi:hypothetical protein
MHDKNKNSNISDPQYFIFFLGVPARCTRRRAFRS